MSSFSDWLIGFGLEPSELEPDEITWLCEDSVFRKIADYCARSRGWTPPRAARTDALFDADELGLDPEYD